MSSSEPFSVRIASRVDEMPHIMALLHGMLADGHFVDEVHNALCVMADEVISNLLTHALADDESRSINLAVQLFDDRVEMEIIDDGPPFNPILRHTPQFFGHGDLAVGGLGLHIVKSLADLVCYQRRGDLNCLLIAMRQPTVAGHDEAIEFSQARADDRRRSRETRVTFPMLVRGNWVESERRREVERRNRTLGGHVALFRGVDIEAVDRILGACPLIDVDEERVLIHKGEKNENLYVLLSGNLDVCLDLEGPAAIRIVPGEFVGEVSLIDGEPASAFVVARPGARVIVIDDDIFWQQIIPLPGVARNLMRAQTRRLRANNDAVLVGLRNELERQQTERDLRVAAELQAGMLPRNFPLFADRPELDLFATMRPAHEIGGDFYDAFLTDDGRLVFAVGDVSGKGIAAALFMVRSMTLLRTEARQAQGPIEMMQRINQLLCRDNPQCMFVTLCLGVLDLASGRVRIGNAGHPPPAVRDADGWRLLAPQPSSLLGVWEGAEFAEREFDLAALQLLVLYSDGVTEAHPGARVELFGESRLLAALDGDDLRAEATVARLAAAVGTFSIGGAPFDDVAVLALSYRPPAA